MENQKRRFDVFAKMFGISNFYTATFSRYDMKLQAEFNTDIVKLAIKYKFIPEVTKTGYLEFKRGQYNIVLTN